MRPFDKYQETYKRQITLFCPIPGQHIQVYSHIITGPVFFLADYSTGSSVISENSS